MPEIPLAAFEDAADRYDAMVLRAPLVDAFCASSPWILSAFEAFADGADAAIFEVDEGWAPMMRMRTVLGRTWMPLEASWGLAAPFVGDDPGAVCARFLEHATEQRDTWDAMFLSGLVRGGSAFNTLVRRLGRTWRLGLGQTTSRCVASLDGGYDAFLGRRAAKFRKNLRRAERRAPEGVRFDVISEATPQEARVLYEEILQVEARSWKGREGHGIDEGPMRTFYAGMVPRLARAGELRVTLAKLDGQTIGYVLGGLRGDGYRGLQISFDVRWTAMSMGNLLQAATVEGLCSEGVRRYDLGTDMPYKRRWAERLVETVPIVVR